MTVAAISVPPNAPSWVASLVQNIQRWFFTILNAPVQVKVYSKARLPDAAKFYGGQFGAQILVSDDAAISSDGPMLCYSDGTNWRHVHDRKVVS